MLSHIRRDSHHARPVGGAVVAATVGESLPLRVQPDYARRGYRSSAVRAVVAKVFGCRYAAHGMRVHA